MQSYLTPELLNDFLENGYIVIENVLTPEKIIQARNELHQYIKKYKGGIHDDILLGQTHQNTVRKKGLTSDLFYSKFKMDLHLDQRLYQTFKEICMSIDSLCKDVVPYIDRVCYRLPDHILAEGGLKLHIDRNPWNMSKAKKIRSVQAFISLTNHYGSNSGGLCVVPRFQKSFNEYFSKSYNKTEAEAGGEFYRMHGLSHTSAQNQLEPVQAPAGSLVIWNNNLPHATCEKLESYDTREVIYLSYLPTNIATNIKYWKEQSKNFVANIPPPSYNDNNNQVDRDYSLDDLNQFQKRMLGI
jgi:ectoine hydroxylase-related dioxygenase (phytanoyl-CoA dioxygenase family)